MIEPGRLRAISKTFESQVSPDRESPPLVVIEPDPSFTVGFLQDLVLGTEILDDRLLLPADQAGQNGEEEVPGLEDEAHTG